VDYISEPKQHHYGDSSRSEIFQIWWKGGKPSPTALQKMIPDNKIDKLPSIDLLRKWIKNEFEPKAASLDRQMMNEIEGRMIQEKVEMLQRHGEIGREMQSKARAALEQLDFEELPANALVRLIVEGVRIERDSVGLPEALEKLLDADDDELVDMIETITEESQAEILVIDNEQTD